MPRKKGAPSKVPLAEEQSSSCDRREWDSVNGKIDAAKIVQYQLHEYKMNVSVTCEEFRPTNDGGISDFLVGRFEFSVLAGAVEPSTTSFFRGRVSEILLFAHSQQILQLKVQRKTAVLCWPSTIAEQNSGSFSLDFRQYSMSSLVLSLFRDDEREVAAFLRKCGSFVRCQFRIFTQFPQSVALEVLLELKWLVSEPLYGKGLRPRQLSAFLASVIQTPSNLAGQKKASKVGEETRNPRRKEDLAEFYRQFKRCSAEFVQSSGLLKKCHMNVQHRDLAPLLRAYQKDAVRWMLWRELDENANEQEQIRWRSQFEPVRFSEGGKTFYYSKRLGHLCAERPAPLDIPPGGILADEMGLGKTVETLALILLNPRRGHFFDEDNRQFSNASSSKTTASSQNSVIGLLLEELVSSVCGSVGRESASLSLRRKRVRSRFEGRRSNAKSEAKKGRKSPANQDSQIDSLKLSCVCFVRIQVQNLGEVIECTGKLCGGSFQHKICMGYGGDFQPAADKHRCPKCLVHEPPVLAKATLIVSPESIAYQWYEEVEKHIRQYAIKVHVYRGVRDEGFVHPSRLANQDVVICSYETLRRELHHVARPADCASRTRELRHPKRYQSLSSPLTAVDWWRVVLDEAQMVECVTTRTAEMCAALRAKNRWCVSGTPLHKSLSEVYGLLYFLGMQPYYVRHWWNELLWKPYMFEGNSGPLLDTLSRVMWRREKCDVREQLGIPEQKQLIYWAGFMAVEEHFYRRTADSCRQDAANILKKYASLDDSILLSDVDRGAVHEMMRPLLRLRNSCVHPQVALSRTGKLMHKKNNGNNNAKYRTMTMEEVLEKMVKETKRECEEELRQYLMARNGLAGCSWLLEVRKSKADVAEVYRDVLRFVAAKEAEGKYRADPLPRIHALHNLAQLIRHFGQTIPPTTSDDQLSNRLERLEKKFLLESRQKLEKVLSDCQDACRKSSEAKQKIEGPNWYAAVWRCCSDEVGQEISDRVKTQLAERQSNECHNPLSFRSLSGLSVELTSFLDKLKQSRENLQKGLLDLANCRRKFEAVDESAVISLVQQAADCHLRPQNRVGKTAAEFRCPICQVHELFESYETCLYNFESREDKDDKVPNSSSSPSGTTDSPMDVQFYAKLRRGQWHPSTGELALKFLSHAVKVHAYPELQQRKLWNSGEDQLKWLVVLKQEFSAFRSFWIALSDYVALRDELSMSKERLRFKTSVEVEMETQSSKNCLNLGAIEYKAPVNAISKGELNESYLYYKSASTSALSRLERKEGHLNYLSNLELTRNGGESSELQQQCPICRLPLGHKWAVLNCGHCFCMDCTAYFTAGCRGRDNVKFDCAVCRARTSYSTVSYVTTTNSSRTHRWPNVNGNFSTKALLLTVSSGARGLNLVEATEVILVHPLLNTAAEQQAIGRVHRIGQTAETSVHRFVIHSSIEEQLHQILGDQTIDTALPLQSNNPLTLGQLRELLFDRHTPHTLG